jgi:hypothetical protein
MFRKSERRIRGNFGQFSRWRELDGRLLRLSRGTPPAMIRARFASHVSQVTLQSHAQTSEGKFMHLTVAHISPIMSLIAGVLILIMPRLLNFIVAIFLILNGAIGLGLLKWLHL